ncbi:HAD-IA family hydrolase [Limnohabitans sp. DCL3]|uniref:HAD-IA family hydrolase n=1 Tax=Limnohabitans sp. DCL3 TaxID=3374103 RepID=UPI003A86D7F3
MKRETVVFDLGGVVFNWEPLKLMREVFPAHAQDDADAGRLLSNVFQNHQPHGDWAQWDRGLIKPDALAQRIAQRLAMEPHEIQALIDALAPHMRVKPETVDLIHELKAANHRLVYLSNMPEELAQWIESDHPFADWFEDGVFSARVCLVKPDDVIYRCAEEKLSMSGQAPVFVDDMQPNIDAAHRNGWRPVRFETAQQVRARLCDLGLLV